MAPSSKRATKVRSQLYLNLLLIEKLVGASSQLKEYVKPGVFLKPNRIAFEVTMHFLIQAYNPQLCESTFTCWPIIERRTQERIFKRDVAAAYSKILGLEKDYRLLPLSPSFLSSPGGERLESFLFKLSSLSLRTALQRRGGAVVPNPPRDLRPRRCRIIAYSRTRGAMKEFLEQVQYFVAFMRYCAETAQNMKDSLVSNLRILKDAQPMLADLQLNESTPLEDVFNEEIVAQLSEQSTALIEALQVIQNQETVVQSCEDAVRTLLDHERPTAVLESEELLDIAALLNRTAGVVKSLSARFGDASPMTTPEMHRELPLFVKELSSISDLMERNLKSAVELTVTTSSPMLSKEPNVDTPDKLRHACQLLEDANTATPLLEFQPATVNPTWQTMLGDTESPPISCVADLLGAKKPGAAAKGTTHTRPGRKPPSVASPSPVGSGKFGCTPVRPRSDIPLKVAPRSKRPASPNPNKDAPKVVGSCLLPKAVLSEALTNSVRPLQVSNGKDALDISTRNGKDAFDISSRNGKTAFDISSRSELNKDDSAQDVLDLAIAVLCPVSSRNPSPKEAVPSKENINIPKTENKFSECMNESPGIKESGPVPNADPDQSMTAKKTTERRQSILDLIQRCKNIVPVKEKTETMLKVENVTEPDEWNDSNCDFSFGSDEENFPGTEDIESKFQLSPRF